MTGWVLQSLLQMEKLRQELVLEEPALRPACLDQAAALPAPPGPDEDPKGGRGRGEEAEAACGKLTTTMSL